MLILGTLVVKILSLPIPRPTKGTNLGFFLFIKYGEASYLTQFTLLAISFGDFVQASPHDHHSITSTYGEKTGQNYVDKLKLIKFGNECVARILYRWIEDEIGWEILRYVDIHDDTIETDIA